MKDKKVELQTALICEAATVDMQNRAVIYGVFNQINAKTVPATHPQFAIFCIWEGETGGKYEEEIKIVSPSGKAIAQSPKMTFEMNASQARLISQFNLMRFEEFGSYKVEISLDGKLEKSISLEVIKVKEES